MVLLILESLGSTELLFILAMALVFFGPRKLPQISRSLGKNLAEFRRASEDFKSTWEREVNLEEFNITGDSSTPAPSATENSILNNESSDASLHTPKVEPVDTDLAVPRQRAEMDPVPIETKRPEPESKSDWL